MGKISIPEENGVNLPTRKRIVSSFKHLILCVFLILKTFFILNRLYFKIRDLTTISIS